MVMRILIFSLILLFCSCGADKLNQNSTKNSVIALTGDNGTQCSCSTDASQLVCGADGKVYSNSCIATCMGQKTTTPGHCQCEGFKVCGEDGNTYDECVAKNSGVKIAKYLACNQIPL